MQSIERFENENENKNGRDLFALHTATENRSVY
jgi:hypothetical protein